MPAVRVNFFAISVSSWYFLSFQIILVHANKANSLLVRNFVLYFCFVLTIFGCNGKAYIRLFMIR